MHFRYSPEQLHQPPKEFWPGYYWVLNAPVDEDKLLGQLHDMHDRGVGSVALFLCVPELQPLFFGGQFDKPYLSKSFFDVIGVLVRECEKLDMHFWLYDEAGFPGGAAGGRVFLSNPEKFARKSIMYSECAIDAEQEFHVHAHDLCAAIFIADTWKVYRPGQTIPPSGIDTRIRVYHIINDSLPNKGSFAPCDPLNLQATEKFIELTHERYKKYLGPALGKTILRTFTDEPQAGETYLHRERDFDLKLAWTDDFAGEFLRRKGYDLIEYLPSLLAPGGLDDPDDLVRLRIDFYDVWSRLFVERFLEPIRNWCRENHLQSGGHFGGENQAVYNQMARFGHILRALRALDVPGVDTIWRQIFPGRRQLPGFLDFALLEAGSNQQFPKYASSVARQQNLPYSFTESFAIYGNGLTPAQMRYVTDFQYVRGINQMVISNYTYDPTGPYMGMFRPNFGPVNPLWKYLDIYHQYTARLGYLLSTGKPVCTTAVYYDIPGIWAGGPVRDRAILLHDQISLALLESQCEFDYIDEDVILTSTCQDGGLLVGPMKYDTLIVPDTRWLSAAAVACLEHFQAHGGRLIVVEGSIRGLSRPTLSISVDQLSRHIAPVAAFETPCQDIRATVRENTDCRIYLLTNETGDTKNVGMKIEPAKRYGRYDPEGDQYYPLNPSTRKTLDVQIEPWGSTIIWEGEKLPDVEWQPWFPSPPSYLEITDWRLRPLRQYWMDDVSLKIDERPNTPPVETPLGDWRNSLGEDFSGDGEYTATFRCPDDLRNRPARLSLGEVKYACSVQLNGQEIGRKIWPPYQLTIPAHLLQASNTLKVTVTNTLANATCSERVKRLWKEKTGAGWPRRAFYHELAWKFEQDSLESGLFGPVRLFFG